MAEKYAPVFIWAVKLSKGANKMIYKTKSRSSEFTAPTFCFHLCYNEK